jgi:site-specific recombinase XerD
MLRQGVDQAGKPFHSYAPIIIELLCLTGCRLSEIVKLRHVKFDASQGCLRLEDTKSGQSLRAIGACAVELLESVERLAGSDCVSVDEWAVSISRDEQGSATRL